MNIYSIEPEEREESKRNNDDLGYSHVLKTKIITEKQLAMLRHHREEYHKAKKYESNPKESNQQSSSKSSQKEQQN